MRLADKTLVHQVHPAKISADVTASIVYVLTRWPGVGSPDPSRCDLLDRHDGYRAIQEARLAG